MLGFLNVNKPLGKTSHDVVNVLRKLLRERQVGHGGTLDPLAEGVLPLAVGKATRLLRFLPQGKVYKAEVLLGKSTTTDDLAGETLTQFGGLLPEEEAIREALSTFVGEFEQIPPLYSAIHHHGKRLYELARQGHLPDDIKARPVVVDSIELLSIDRDRVSLRIACGKGTYIRSIARDLGAYLETGACLSALVREQSGRFDLKESKTIDELAQLSSENRIEEALVDPVEALRNAPGLTLVTVDEEIAARISMGQRTDLKSSAEDSCAAAAGATEALVVTEGGSLVAVCQITELGQLKPEVVIANSSSNKQESHTR